jgi:hypothetical protein
VKAAMEAESVLVAMIGKTILRQDARASSICVT